LITNTLVELYSGTEAAMPRANKPSNGPATTPRSARPSTKGNGSGADHFNDQDAIAKRAYEIYLNRGGQHGADLDDWLEAERQLRPGPSAVTGPVTSKPRRRKVASEGSEL
jgi:hypothetical protein